MANDLTGPGGPHHRCRPRHRSLACARLADRGHEGRARRPHGKPTSSRRATRSSPLADEALAFAADVADQAAVERSWPRPSADFGPIYLLVNNAARSASWDGTKLWESDPDDWWSRVETNLYGPYLFARYALPAWSRAARATSWP